MDNTFIIIIVIIAIVVLFTGIKEGFALSAGILSDVNTIDPTKYYFVGSRNASGENPGCIVQFPLQVYKVA